MNQITYQGVQMLQAYEHIWITRKRICQILDIAPKTLWHHIQNLEELNQFKEGTHVITLPVTRQEGSRTVTRDIRHYSELAVMRIGFRVNSEKALAFQEWAAETLLRLKRDGVVYEYQAPYEDLSRLLDHLGVPRFPMGGLLARVTALAGAAMASRKKRLGAATTALATTGEPTAQNVIQIAHAHLDEVGCPVFDQSNEAERLAVRCTYLAFLAGKQFKAAKALLEPPAEPDYELIADETLNVLGLAINERDALSLIGFRSTGYKNNGIALYPDKAYELISRCLARKWEHIPDERTIWTALMKTGKLVRIGKEKGRSPWLVKVSNATRIILISEGHLSPATQDLILS